MNSHMVAQVNIANKYEDFNYGWKLYEAGQLQSRCTNVEQQRGWKSARRGAFACATVDVTFAIGGNASDADYALGAWHS